MKRPQGSQVSRRSAISSSAVMAATILILAAGAAGAPTKPRILVDFEDPGDVTLAVDGAEAQRVTAGGGRALQVITRRDVDYPSVRIEPRAGKWDLREFDGVAMDVRNPEGVPVRVLLSLNNPGADGRNNCNTESVNVPARGQARLVVPFGMWHGESNHPIDRSNVVSVTVLLDRPGRQHRFVVDTIRAVSMEQSDMEDLRSNSFFHTLKPAFGRGINLGNALEAPTEGAWGVTLKEEYFDRIKSAGFTSVRIPVRWSTHAEPSAPYRIDPAFFARVDWAVRHCLKRGLTPVVNIHHYEEVVMKPDEHRSRFLALWAQIADHYKGYPEFLALELLNEPNGPLTADKWNSLLADAIAVVRRTNPTRKIVVGPVGWNSIGELASLKLPENDRNLVVTFHYYNPFTFTHQGASWTGPESAKWLGTKWTGTPSEKLAVMRDLDTAIRWAVEHRRPVYMGEFGAYEKADLESRARWTRFVADEAIKRKIGFAYWEFCAGFGVYDAAKGEWVEPLKQALLPAGEPPAR